MSRSSPARRTRVAAGRHELRRFGVVVGLAVVIALTALVSTATRTDAMLCFDGAGRPTDAASSVAGYGGEQLANAKTIVEVGAAMGAPRTAQEIAVMTAMGESGLRVLDYGDTVGPDSRGLFQQRDNGAWGSYEDRMDPSISATNFYRVLLVVPGWETLEPTVAAHLVQRNADERHYERYFPAAQEVVAEVTDAALVCSTPSS